MVYTLRAFNSDCECVLSEPIGSQKEGMEEASRILPMEGFEYVEILCEDDYGCPLCKWECRIKDGNIASQYSVFVDSDL